MKLKLVSNGAQAQDIEVSDATFGARVQRIAGAPGRRRRTWRRRPRRHQGARRPRPKCAAAAASRGARRARGQARAGSIRSPIWVGGGRAFAAKPRDFAQKVNRKMYRGAMQAMLSELARQERLGRRRQFELEAPKTKLLAAKLKELELAATC